MPAGGALARDSKPTSDRSRTLALLKQGSGLQPASMALLAVVEGGGRGTGVAGRGRHPGILPNLTLANHLLAHPTRPVPQGVGRSSGRSVAASSPEWVNIGTWPPGS